ncbi:MAG: hypothetical protein EOM11_07480 [Erysipelotrichia bacterium]|nr:hypothetical protein [Erysipelotrichia bacterium]
MKRSVKYCCIVVIIAILLAIFTFILFNTGILMVNPESFAFFYFLLTLIAIALLITLMKMQSNPCDKMKKAYCCCGHLASIGTVGSIILALLTSLSSYDSDFMLYAGIALSFFFLVLMLGGVVCFLYTLNGCHSECIPDKDDCPVSYENNAHEYSRKEYIYPNNKRR